MPLLCSVAIRVALLRLCFYLLCSYYKFFIFYLYLYIYSLVLCYILHCPLSGPDLTYISLLIISCIIEYVTNKRTLNLDTVLHILFDSIFFFLPHFFPYLYLCIFSCVCIPYDCTVHGADLTYILLLVIFCIIVYVTNKTLTNIIIYSYI